MYKLLLALHLLFAIFAIGPLVAAATTAARGVRTSDAAATASAARLLRVYAIASVLVVALGMGLMSIDSPYQKGRKVGEISDLWIWLSLVLWAAAVAVTLGVVVPALTKATEVIKGGGAVATMTGKVAAGGGIVDGAVTRELRRRVLRPHLRPHDVLPGDDLPQALHIAAQEGDTVVGTCFVYAEACEWRTDREPAWRLKQMASAPERRGEGIGGAVLAAATAVAVEHGARLLWCHARDVAVPFYAAHGWEVVGDVFVDADTSIPHYRMSVEPPHPPTSSTR